MTDVTGREDTIGDQPMVGTILKYVGAIPWIQIKSWVQLILGKLYSSKQDVNMIEAAEGEETNILIVKSSQKLCDKARRAKWLALAGTAGA